MQWLWQFKHLKGYYGKVINFLIQSELFHEYKINLKSKSVIIHLSYITFMDTSCVTIHLAREMRQNKDT